VDRCRNVDRWHVVSQVVAVVASERYGLQIHDDFSSGNEGALGSGLRNFFKVSRCAP
jgi:hypothetical protein